VSEITIDSKTIKKRLGLNQPRRSIEHEINASIETMSHGSMFRKGGLCSGYHLRPLTKQYFVAQEFNASRNDLRCALSDALNDFGLTPICADDSLWSGHILCKISALIHATPFGVYQLTTSQNRNVYLELGIAMGLGRTFVLVKDKDASISSLAFGLEYFPINSFLELRLELGARLRQLLADIVHCPPIPLPSPGSQSEVFIAHGDLETIDFSVVIGKAVAEYGLTPVIASDPTGTLSKYLLKEKVPHRILGMERELRLDETVRAIQTSRVGIYRIEKNADPDSFLALGISMGLNRPGLLIQRKDADTPSDLRGINALKFNSYTELSQSFQSTFGSLLEKYREI